MMSSTDDYYQVLDVSPTATSREIKKAYHRLALKLHPDKQATEEARKKTKDPFRQVKDAYEVLLDPIQRKRYDEKRQQKQQRSSSTKRPPHRTGGGESSTPGANTGTNRTWSSTGYQSTTPNSGQAGREQTQSNSRQRKHQSEDYAHGDGAQKEPASGSYYQPGTTHGSSSFPSDQPQGPYSQTSNGPSSENHTYQQTDTSHRQPKYSQAHTSSSTNHNQRKSHKKKKKKKKTDGSTRYRRAGKTHSSSSNRPFGAKSDDGTSQTRRTRPPADGSNRSSRGHGRGASYTQGEEEPWASSSRRDPSQKCSPRTNTNRNRETANSHQQQHNHPGVHQKERVWGINITDGLPCGQCKREKRYCRHHVDQDPQRGRQQE